MKLFTGIGVAQATFESGPTLSTLSIEATATATLAPPGTSIVALVELSPAEPHTNLLRSSLLGTTPGVKLAPPHWATLAPAEPAAPLAPAAPDAPDAPPAP